MTAQTRTLAQQVQSPQPAAVETQNATSPQPAPAATETQVPATQEPVPEEAATPIPAVQQPAPAEVETPSTPSPQPDTAQAEPKPETEETFESCWTKMVDVIFAKKPAFYHQLRDYQPRFENEIIYVDVENDFQKNQLEMSKRAMLEYWRNQFKLNVNDIEFVIHEHEKKKVIYTSEDKVNNMLEQNPELKDFLQVLNFRIKD